MKQRRVSLPGTSLVHPDRDADILGIQERQGAQDSMLHTINGWGVSFRDDLGLPPSSSGINAEY